MSTGMRALDHAMELMYHPTSTEMPCRQMCMYAAGSLFENLPRYKQNPQDEDVITRLQLAAFASLGFFALNVRGPLGLSHTLGYVRLAAHARFGQGELLTSSRLWARPMVSPTASHPVSHWATWSNSRLEARMPMRRSWRAWRPI